MSEVFKAAIAKAGLSIKAKFVPFSQSRNATRESGDNSHQDKRCLNWRVTLLRNVGTLHTGEPKQIEILTTDYSAGIGHSPAYKNPAFKSTVRAHNTSTDQTAAIALEIEQGFAARVHPWGLVADKKRALLPNEADVIYSLIRDGDAIDYPTYEEWADSYGYDKDSSKGEAIYEACLEHGLKLRAVLGETVLQELREASQDY
jgi:hypothetical protein